MKVKLLNDARVLFKKGETIEVSPEEAYKLFRLGKAEEVKAPKKKKED